ncbi:hypothetical protein U6A24_19450 [Aquimarina gracilis]|uniref:Outer membrane beta-barrel domain-containing protein n=1 Tax=Aquimarina gracilis TaxID=874422 RepID=A0ABU6A0P9_9FLAO|nr:hypothetical protein [Aquimarina gracilis]MEB3347662.1 hypothetical protein [Aquimarina gracilis]
MKRATLLFTTLVLSFNITQAQGKLEKAEESLAKKEQRNNRNSRSGNNDNDDDFSENNFLAETFGALLVEAVLYTSYYTIIEIPIETEYAASTASITKYPYFNATKGNYAYEWGEDTQVFRTTLSSRFISENSKLYGNHMNLDMRFLQRAGLEIDYLQLWEENTNFGSNSLAIYTALGKYHRVRTERFNAWWGLGAAYVDGEIDEWGFTYGLGAELFFTKPFSLETTFNQTFINEETVNKFTILLNYHVNRYKVSGGYEHLKIGSLDLSTFSVGVGVSF